MTAIGRGLPDCIPSSDAIECPLLAKADDQGATDSDGVCQVRCGLSHLGHI